MRTSNPEHESIVEKCEGCNRIREQKGWPHRICGSYLYPSVKWRNGDCPMASHIKKECKKQEDFVDPLKKSKKSMKKR